LIIAFVPESPIWLYREGRIGDAEIAQQRLGIGQPILGTPRISRAAASLISDSFEPDDYSLGSLLRYFSRIRRPEVYRPLAITVTLFFFAEASGLSGLVSYMIDAVTASSVKIDPYFLTVICGVLQFIGCVSATFAIPYIGLKTLSMWSFLGLAVGYLVLEFSLLFEDAFTPNVFNYVHCGSICAILLMGTAGVSVVPFCILGEIFPMGAKGYAGLSLLSGAVFNFILLKTFPYMLAQHEKASFFVYGVASCSGAVFVSKILPETIGRTMERKETGLNGSEQSSDSVRTNSILYEKLAGP